MLTDRLGFAARAARRLSRSEAHQASSKTTVWNLLGRAMAYGSTAALVIFHGQLLWQRIADLTVLEPLVALNWAFAVLVFGGFVHLQRSGFSLFRGRKALILWLLVLMLHAGSVPAVDGPLQWGAESGLLAASLWSFGLLVLLGLRVELTEALGLARVARRPCGVAWSVPDQPGFFAPLSPRPPPA